MTRRALVIGASLRRPAQGPPAEELDAERMADKLRELAFEDIALLRGAEATRDGILAGYRGLAARAAPGDAAVVYFSGHGGMVMDPRAPGGERALPRRFQFVAPTDYAYTTDDDFRGISAWELSCLLRELTDRTANVTAIFDCCFAAQMSRGPEAAAAVPRALPKITWLTIGNHYDRVRARLGPLEGPGAAGNPRAVRLAACGDWQTAFQTADEHGRPVGALTQALLATLDEIGDAPVSWRALGDAIRARVQRAFSMQRPIVEGPVRRRLFSVSEVDTASIPIARRGEELRLDAGRIAGVSVGDVYGVTGAGATGFTPEAAIGRVRIERVEALHAIARPIEEAGGGGPALPEAGAVAWPLELALARRAVWLDGAGPGRAALEAAIAASARLEVAGARADLVGELRLRGGELQVIAADGRVLDPDPAPWALAAAVGQLEQLAAARALTELEGEHGLAEADVEIEWGTVHDGGVLIPRPAHGAALGLGDRIYLRLRNRTRGQRFAHVFGVGLCGRIRLLSAYAAAGIRLGPEREELVSVGPEPASASSGLPLYWPLHARRDEPGIDTLIVIVTAQPVELRGLETAAPPEERGGVAASPLQQLVEQLHEGGTRGAAAAAADPFCVVRRSFVLYPLEAPLAGPAFVFDEAPLALLGAHAGEGPRELEVRLTGLTARRDVRLDALICTRGGDRGRVYQARTLELAAGAAPVDAPLWRGPVQELVDVAIWIGPGRVGGGGRGELGALLEAAAGAGSELGRAVDALVVDEARAVGDLAGGACAALARAAGELLRAGAPGTAGFLHASFTAAAGYGVGRHPAAGLYRAEDVELGLAIEAG
jgi:hypothetical protein